MSNVEQGISNTEAMVGAHKIIGVIFATILIITANGCGVKGPPVVPGYTDLPIVQDLTYQVSRDKLVLSWTLPKSDSTQSPKIVHAGVYRLKQPLGKHDCPGCPQTFEPVAKLPARSDTMTYTDGITPGFQYFYKIILSDMANRSGGDSNIVHYIPEGNP